MSRGCLLAPVERARIYGSYGIHHNVYYLLLTAVSYVFFLEYHVNLQKFV